MILDDALKIATAQAFTDTGGGQVTGSSIDLGNTTVIRDIAAGKPMCLLFQVTVAAAGSTDTFILKVVDDDNSSLTSPAVLSQRGVLKAALTAGSLHVLVIPPGVISQRYLGGYVAVGSSDTVTMSCWVAGLEDIREYDRFYPTGIRMDYVS